ALATLAEPFATFATLSAARRASKRFLPRSRRSALHNGHIIPPEKFRNPEAGLSLLYQPAVIYFVSATNSFPRMGQGSTSQDQDPAPTLLPFDSSNHVRAGRQPSDLSAENPWRRRTSNA